jgi:predicted TIM-barrel fold metal-dependent hydrolase
MSDNAVASTNERYTVISADGHAGADLLDYRPYLASRYHDDFDAWAAEYEIPYEDMTGADGDRNWNSKRRLAELEADGIVAEVLFPNTVPPFFPKASLTAQPPPIDAGDSERRWAGLQAHNRWLVDFCGEAPGRRAGIAQIGLSDIDASVAEVRWAKEAGLTGGVLLPGVPPGLGLPQLYDPYYEPLWRVCAELDLPINHHGGSANPPMDPSDEGTVVFLLEVTWWSHRALAHLIVGGVLERYPDLQVVFTEQGTAWVPDELMRLDYFFHRMRTAVGSQEYVWGAPVMEKLSLQPSEYFARQCHIGASFMRQAEVPLRHKVGLDRIMWGCDYPHKEASYPHSELALRQAFAGVPHDEVDKLLAGNAAALYGFDLDLLRPIGDEVGPLVDRVNTPLEAGEVPKEAEKCPALAGLSN